MTRPPVISILIVNYNGGELFDVCLRSLANEAPRRPFEIVVVDNASRDGSADRAVAAYPSIRLVRNPGNVGLARAFNQALRASTGRYLLCLDNDTVALPGAIDALADYLDEHEDVAVAGSRLLNPDGTLQHTARRFPHPLNALFGRRSLLTRLFPRNPISRGYLMSERETLDTPYEVDWVSTAALMTRRTATDKVGGLDEDFFVYWVDADWCHRFKRAGWRIVCVPASSIVHNENLKAGRRDARRYRMIVDFHRGAWLYYRKNQLQHRLGPMALVCMGSLAARAAVLIAVDEARRLLRRVPRRV
jgi:N-acetylglucosaminyl-diphospho-decaprenol L-rhamnosyltransferase